jgi:exonuclease SbcC
VRPLRLSLENFICYRGAIEVDFSALDLFVISGPTGSGKSALIDAICYALYGRVPREDGVSSLISHNADSMFVDFEFAMGGVRYRVTRTINKQRRLKKDGEEVVTRGVSPVQLERHDGQDWVPLEGRVAAIDAEIERIVGLDFDSFTRCVLLPQGRFQEFLAGDRKVRRGILVELLDLEVYQRMMKRANEIASEYEKAAAGLQGELNALYFATPEALTACAEQQAEIHPRLAAAEAECRALSEAVTTAADIGGHRRQQRDAEAQHAACREELQAATALLTEGRSKIERLEQDAQAQRLRVEACGYDANLHRALTGALQAARSLEGIDGQIAELAAALGDGSALAKATEDLDNARAAEAEAARALAEAQAAHEAGRAEHDAEHVRSRLKPGDPCPVCGGVYTPGKERPAPALKALRDAVSAGEQILTSRRNAANEASNALAGLQATREARQQQLDALEARRDEAATSLAHSLPAGVGADRPSIERLLHEQAAASEVLKREEAAYRDLLEEAARTKSEVQQAEQALSALEGRLRTLEETARDACAAAGTLTAKLREVAAAHAWQAACEVMDAGKNPRDALSEAEGIRRAEASELARALAVLEAEHERIESALRRVAQIGDELTVQRDAQVLYQELGQLLNAGNFQKFVLEEAMSILAAGASGHLAALYPRFSLSCKGDDFTIVDEWQAGAERSARTLSGGESFIASLALALSLSEHLPELRRLSAPVIESLFLDEGFGTLDPDTLETVITALEGLRSQERLVGIITHVPELAQRIESRIEVHKAREGSTLTVSGV